jgi:hypothetical protein
MLDEEFDVLGEDDLVLLSRQFERLYMNLKKAQRSSGMCYRCRKHRHFIAECPEATENKPEHKHRPRTDHRHRSRNGYKGKNKSERSTRKSGGHKKAGRAMVVGASDNDSSSCYSATISSGEEKEVDQQKSKQSSKNINGPCFTAQGFCGMPKSQKYDSDSDSKDEVGGMEDF